MMIYVAQLKFTKCALEANASNITKSYLRSVALSADLAVFPSFSLSGYFRNVPIPEDGFFLKCQKKLQEIAYCTLRQKTRMIVPSILEKGGELFRAYFLLSGGTVSLLAELPINNYDTVFAVEVNGPDLQVRFYSLSLEESYESGRKRSSTIVFFDHSPYINGRRGKIYDFLNKISYNAVWLCPIGGFGSYVFIGGSIVLNQLGERTTISKFGEGERLIDLSENVTDMQDDGDRLNEDYLALMLSLRDYAANFDSVVLGVSGGVDSALVATIAADALGADKVYGYMLPTKYTSVTSLTDAVDVAKNLGIHYRTISIESVLSSVLASLSPLFIDCQEDITEENIQSRIRAVILMALSNKFSRMLLSTSNKSEALVGYSTIYGDMCGGFAPIKDVYKTDVYKLCHWRNRNIPQGSLCRVVNVISPSIIDKAPSAELKPDQRDQDTLPAYEVLDYILKLIVDMKNTQDQVVELGCDPTVVQQVISLVRRAEFKRLQSPLGTLIGRI